MGKSANWEVEKMNYSPLRYPGGKAKFSPCVKGIIHKSEDKIETYIEPFAGGAGVALDLLFSGEVKRIVINDYDKAIYSFWRAVIEETDRLIELIKNTEVTIGEWYKQKEVYLNNANRYSVELAFATFFLNRTNRSGILNAGPIGGYTQQGAYSLDARYNKEKLIQRIKNIAKLKKNIYIYNKEIRAFIEQVLPKYSENGFVYFDPPYYRKGNRLYKNSLSQKDHKEIAAYIKNKVSCEWIITYDDTEEIKEIYKNDFYKTYKLSYSLVKSETKSEIIIFKNKMMCPSNEELNKNNIKIFFY